MGCIRIPENMEIERSSFFVGPEFGKTLEHMKILKVFCSSTQVYGVPKRFFFRNWSAVQSPCFSSRRHTNWAATTSQQHSRLHPDGVFFTSWLRTIEVWNLKQILETLCLERGCKPVGMFYFPRNEREEEHHSWAVENRE